MSDSATMSVRALHRTDLPKLSLSTKAAATVLAIVAAVALPQLFHVIGAVSGQGTMLGVAFLPMHLPIIFVGLIAGPAVGAIAGAAAPLASFLLSGMPMLAMLISGRHKPDLIESQFLISLFCQNQMSYMNRIKGSPHNSNSFFHDVLLTEAESFSSLFFLLYKERFSYR